MTPAIKVLEKAGIEFSTHEYSHDAAATSYGEEAAESLKITPDRVFKTLVVSMDTSNYKNNLAVAIVPVCNQLDFKAVAKSLKSKKASMADSIAAQNTTGYILGGISPFGQKKKLPYLLDGSAKSFETIFVSGGKRGLEIEISPLDLITLCKAISVDIKK